MNIRRTVTAVVIVERRRILKIPVDIFRYHFEGQQNLHMLNIGCGDGVVTKYIRDSYPLNITHSNHLFILIFLIIHSTLFTIVL